MAIIGSRCGGGGSKYWKSISHPSSLEDDTDYAYSTSTSSHASTWWVDKSTGIALKNSARNVMNLKNLNTAGISVPWDFVYSDINYSPFSFSSSEGIDFLLNLNAIHSAHNIGMQFSFVNSANLNSDPIFKIWLDLSVNYRAMYLTTAGGNNYLLQNDLTTMDMAVRVTGNTVSVSTYTQQGSLWTETLNIPISRPAGATFVGSCVSTTSATYNCQWELKGLTSAHGGITPGRSTVFSSDSTPLPFVLPVTSAAKMNKVSLLEFNAPGVPLPVATSGGSLINGAASYDLAPNLDQEFISPEGLTDWMVANQGTTGFSARDKFSNPTTGTTDLAKKDA